MYYFFDRTWLEGHFERMARKGWALDRMGVFGIIIGLSPGHFTMLSAILQEEDIMNRRRKGRLHLRNTVRKQDGNLSQNTE